MTDERDAALAVQYEVLREANQAFDMLLNGQTDAAVKLMHARPYSPWHHLTVGMFEFLKAALGQETQDLEDALEALHTAERLSTSVLVTGKAEDIGWAKHIGWWAPSTESQLIQADALLLQAMCLLLSESRMATMQAAYKLNKCYRLSAKAFKEVLPGQAEGQSAEQIASWLAALWTSTAAYDRAMNRSMQLGQPTPTWADDVAVSSVVTTACFQKGLFDIVYALLPPSAQSVTSLIYSPGDVKTAVNLLKVAARHGSGTHSTFAALALLTFDTLTMQLSPWVANRGARTIEAQGVLDAQMARQPHAIIWRWQAAKLVRARGDMHTARNVLAECTAAPELHFPQAETMLSWDLMMCLMAQGNWLDLIPVALRLAEINAHGQATYFLMALGALLMLPSPTADQNRLVQDLWEVRLPGSVKPNGSGRLTPAQKFVTHRLEDWQNRVLNAKPGTTLAEVINISPILELGLFFGLYHDCTPQMLTLTLRSLATGHAHDNAAERAVRCLLKGVIHVAAGRYIPAKPFLEMAISFSAPSFVRPVAHLEMAGLTLKVADQALTDQDKEAWKTPLAQAEAHLDAAAKCKSYDFAMRVGLRSQALRLEIASKRESVKPRAV